MKRIGYGIIGLTAVFVLAATPLAAQDAASLPETETDTPLPVVILPRAEIGYLGVLHHEYRIGALADGNVNFDFVNQGGQEILFPYQRFAIDIGVVGQHWFTLLYQPLTLSTRIVAGQNNSGAVVIDGVDFGNRAVDIVYGFDFWRFSYLFDFLPQAESAFGVGLSLQFRNASISFTSVGDDAAGALRVVSQDLGPVPILKLRGDHWFSDYFGLAAEVDGFYASSAFFNGADFAFEGWIWDGALTIRTRVFEPAMTYLSLRTIGGGANGTSGDSVRVGTQSVSGETYNSLATLAVSIGAVFEGF